MDPEDLIVSARTATKWTEVFGKKKTAWSQIEASTILFQAC